MSFLDRLFSWNPPAPAAAPRASFQSAGGGTIISTPEQLEQALRTGSISSSGEVVNAHTAMGVSAVYACVRLLSGSVATLPLHVKRRVDARTRVDASETSLWRVLRRKPNPWQKPAQFRRMLQAHVLLRGNGYAAITRGARGDVISLIPLHPDRVRTVQKADYTLEYEWTRKDGRRITIAQRDMLHLVGLTLDGVNGVSPLTYARETIGLSLAMERHGGTLFKNGAQVGGVLKTDQKLGNEAVATLARSLDEYRANEEKAGRMIVLEQGLEYQAITMTQEDAQWIEGRKFSRADIAMFFGVPPHMIGDTEKSTSWGSGIEAQTQGFVTFTLEDHLTMWEEALTLDCLPEANTDIYVRFNRNALVRGDIKARWEAYVKGLQWGVYSPNRVLELEDENPREGGDIYYDPPNTAGQSNDGQTQDNPDALPPA